MHQQGVLYSRIAERVQNAPYILKTTWLNYMWKIRSNLLKIKYFEIDKQVKINADPNDKLSCWLYVYDFEKSEREFVKRYLGYPGYANGKQQTFIDVGANIGLFSLTAARVLERGGTVHSFEPCKEIYEKLSANVALNNLANLKLNNVALSDCSKQLTLNVCLDGLGVYNSFADPVCENAVIRPELVDCIKLDDYVDEYCSNGVELIKIDVEGWEAAVIEGGKKILSSDSAPVMLVEFCDSAARNAGSSCKHLREAIEHLGFSLYRYNFQNRKLISEPYREEYVYDNLICLKNKQEVLKRVCR
jgi:FkbM family methyltransferase